MISIDDLIGMPLRYALSVLQENKIPYLVERTTSRSHFFHCDETKSYVIRVKEREGVWHLLVNYSLEMSASVAAALGKDEEQDD